MMNDQASPQAEGEVRHRSFADVVVDLISSPAELFEDIRVNPAVRTAHWLAPLVVLILMGLLVGQLIVNNSSLADQLGSTIRKGFEQQVQAGKMTQEQADQVYDQFARPGSTMFMISQVGAIVIGTPIVLFSLSVIYWLLGKWVLKGQAPYMKVVEVVGLTLIIAILEAIVTTLLVFIMNSVFATPSLALFVSDFDVANKLHVAMAKINGFTFWSLSVISIGLARILVRPLGKVIPLVFGAWLAWAIVSVATGVGAGM
ncbi:MAG: YIP1 family protein [Ignavibacteria bacterium]|nr:YIP1 family protein [Ignavibacteria bacterium]